MNYQELDEILTVLVKHNVASAKIGENEFNIILPAPEEKKHKTPKNNDDFGYSAQQAGF